MSSSRRASAPETPQRLNRAAWFATVAGMSGSLVGVGLARFAYTPLIPPLIEANWFSAADAVSLGAANFAGYLAGALLGRHVAMPFGNTNTLRALMLVATLAFFACAWPLSVSWFFVWRFLSGFSGGAIMVLVATTILPHVPRAQRGFVCGMVFCGLGLGIAASGTLIPQLLQFGLWTTWMGLGALSLGLTALAWFGWPKGAPAMPEIAPLAEHIERGRISLRFLYVQYAANALGIVAIIVLLVDYIARGLGLGASLGAGFWVIYGLAAIAGPVVSGYVSDRIGSGRAYGIALFAQTVAVAAIALSGNLIAIGIATAILGILTPGMVVLVLGRIHEILPDNHDGQHIAWGKATTVFALFQMLGGYFYAWIFARSQEDYTLIFLVAASAMAFALCVNLANAVREHFRDKPRKHAH
ncbi:YbfB/YjiJ family MFS transporter [Parvibaculum sp.]|uniref:YbfB/YjiJ family MFS transporter n=1 Tax=Parvibaculum sp. TaxID=2024848 RepID=UPI0032970853